MAKRKKFSSKREINKYPYNVKLNDTDNYLSDKICCYAIKMRKKTSKTVKLFLIYGEVVIRVTNTVVPNLSYGMGVPPLPPLPFTGSPPIMRSLHSNVDSTKANIIAQIMKSLPKEIDFNEKEINLLYEFSIEYNSNYINQEELITKISNLRGGSYVNVIAAMGVIGAMIIVLTNAWVQPTGPGTIPVPHLQGLDNKRNSGNHFGYRNTNHGPRTLTFAGATQNAGSDKKDPGSVSYSYSDIMSQLDKQSDKKVVTIEIAGQTFNIQNPYRETAYELEDKVANKLYNGIRACDTDVSDIAENLGYKADNIKKVKDHVFYNEHLLDQYVSLGEKAEYSRFDPNLQQGLAWKRLEAGIHTQDDITWIKHELAEMHHEKKYDAGYCESHNRAQSLFDGAPWDNNW